MVRAAPSRIRLTEADAGLVKGMIARGDRQHDIAAWFGVNGGRIAEVSSRDNFGHVNAIHADLPPSGPYLTGRGSSEAKAQLETIKTKLTDLLSEVEDTLNSIT